MNPTAVRLEARRSRALTVWLAAITALYAGFITLFYANVAANAAEFNRLLEMYPKELLAAFGIEGNFADPGVFLSGYVFSFLWPLVAAIAAIVLATRVAADADRGFLDVVLAGPVDRARYLLGSITVQLVALSVVAGTLVLAVIGADLAIEPDLPAGRVALSVVHTIAFGAAIAGPSTLLAVLTLDRGRAAAFAAGTLVIMYMLNVVAAIAPDWDVVASVSVFRYFDLRGFLGGGAYPIVDTILLATVAAAGWLLALVAFRRRDLAV